MYNSILRSKAGRLALASLGAFLMAVGINIFTAPLNLYTSGLVGYAQLIRTVLARYLNISFHSFDISGILYYLLNIPIIFITFRSLEKSFFVRTLFIAAVFSFFTTFIPVPTTPILNDTLTSVLVAGICVGVGDGIILTCQCSAGGLDMLGLYYSKKSGMPVGQFGIYANIVLFAACALLFDYSVVIYSVVYMVFSSIVVDRMHQQSINVQAFIFTKDGSDDIPNRIMAETGRGVTCWNGFGAYSNESSRILCTCINRYEQEQLERIVKSKDPQAFIIMIPGVHINGNFIRKV